MEDRLIRYRHGHRIAVSGWGRGRLRRHAAVDGITLSRAVAGRRNSVRADRISPNGSMAAVAVERVIHGVATAGHLANGDCCARSRPRI